MGLAGILVAPGFLMWLSFRGWSVLPLAPAVAIIAAALAGEPLLAHWTRTFMNSAAQFIAQFFAIFLLGALFGKLMDDSGSVQAIAHFMSARLGAAPGDPCRRACGRTRHLRWGEPFRCLFRIGADGAGIVSCR
jgi:H+/gluconate symporter-like permease